MDFDKTSAWHSQSLSPVSVPPLELCFSYSVIFFFPEGLEFCFGLVNHVSDSVYYITVVSA